MVSRVVYVDGKPQAGATAELDVKSFYQDLEDCYRLQISRDEVVWVDRHITPERPVEVTLNLSCGIQATPHLMRVRVALFDALGIDYVATAGTKFCCGRTFGNRGNTVTGDKIFARSLDRLAAWQSTVNVQCCGSCLIEFKARIEDLLEETGDAPFEVVHMTQFLLDKLYELGDAVPWAPTVERQTPLRVLLHAEGTEMHETKEEARLAVIETLGLIPGVEFVGMVEDPLVGPLCRAKPREGGGVQGHSELSNLTPSQYRQVQAELEEQARAVGADAIVTDHHKCHREWSKFGSERLPVVHYQALLAQALGVEIPDRFQTLWRLGDPEKVLEHSRPQWESWGMTEDKARASVRRFFVPEFAAAMQECPCEGDCLGLVSGSEIIEPRSEVLAAVGAPGEGGEQ